MSEEKTRLTEEQLEQAAGGTGGTAKYRCGEILYRSDNLNLRVVIRGHDDTGDILYSTDMQEYKRVFDKSLPQPPLDPLSPPNPGSGRRWEWVTIHTGVLLLESTLDTCYQRESK